MKAISLKTNSYDETVALGKRLARFLKPGDIVCLFGDLGAGKTALTRGLTSGLKADEHEVHSPTFVLMNAYHGKCPVYHFDLYRIAEADLFDLGYEEFFYGDGVSVVEWAERLGTLTPRDHWHVVLEHAGEDKRVIKVSVKGQSLTSRFLKAAEGLV